MTYSFNTNLLPPRNFCQIWEQIKVAGGKIWRKWWMRNQFVAQFKRLGLCEFELVRQCILLVNGHFFSSFLYKRSKISQKTVTMILLAGRSILALFGFDAPVKVHCFDWSLVSGVLWWIHVSLTVTKRRKKSFMLQFNFANLVFSMVKRSRLLSIGNTCGTHLSMSCLTLTRTFNLKWLNTICIDDLWMGGMHFIKIARSTAFKFHCPLFYFCNRMHRVPINNPVLISFYISKTST